MKGAFGDGASADDVLCRALTPPKEAAVAAAVAALKVRLRRRTRPGGAVLCCPALGMQCCPALFCSPLWGDGPAHTGCQ